MQRLFLKILGSRGLNILWTPALKRLPRYNGFGAPTLRAAWTVAAAYAYHTLAGARLLRRAFTFPATTRYTTTAPCVFRAHLQRPTPPAHYRHTRHRPFTLPRHAHHRHYNTRAAHTGRWKARRHGGNLNYHTRASAAFHAWPYFFTSCVYTSNILKALRPTGNRHLRTRVPRLTLACHRSPH